MALADAVKAFVRPQTTLHLCWSNARPNAAVLELVRQFAGRKPDFTVSSVGFANMQATLVAAGIVRRLITAYAGESYPAGGVNPVFQHAIDAGEVEIENWSQWTFVQRLMAGALGLPFLPTRSLAGSGLAEQNRGVGYAEVTDPFGGESVGAVAPLVPDIAFLQGLAADAFGNVVMSPPYGESHWGALAARDGVIACVERIVSTDAIRSLGTLVRIPGHVVKAVCLAPFGSHPYGAFSPPQVAVPSYVEDDAFIAEAALACKTPEAIRAWMDEWVFGLADHDAYLAKLGPCRLAALTERAAPLRWRADLAAQAPADPAGYTDAEAMIVISARRIAGRVRKEGFQTVLAGIGASNIASWLAEHLLTAEGTDVALISEIGIYGYAPRPGEPFVFSNRNIATARQLTDVSVTLGTLVSGAHNRCLGAMGAAIIDRFGHVGSTYDQNGRFIVGSGGANDIASAASELLITVNHGRRRLVEHVNHVTSPGTRVKTVVTSRAVLARDAAEAPLRLVSVVAPDTVTTEAAIAAARADCGWDLDVAVDVDREPPPTARELALIRAFDPERVFLGALPKRPEAGATP
ncbi:MAG: putative glutaconate CoA-transferase [Rhodospirillales bacterium]|nr:putative glutaconate CoA-transferase [Rhodospirillales bacterium]